MLRHLRGPATLCAAVALAAVVACAPLRVRVDYDREVDFSRYRTFDWLEPPPGAGAETSESANPFARNSLLDKRVRTAVERELAARGFVKTDGEAGQAVSFRVHYHVIIRERLAAYSTPDPAHHWGYHGYHGSGFELTQFQEGTLVVDVIDPQRNQLTWRGWAVGRNRDGHYTEQEVKTAVRRVLERFPPAPSG